MKGVRTHACLIMKDVCTHNNERGMHTHTIMKVVCTHTHAHTIMKGYARTCTIMKGTHAC